MKFSISLLSFCILSFIIVFSCSTEEVQDTTPPPSIIQNPEPETPNPTQYTLNVNAGEGGSVSSEGGTYDEGTDINLTATPNGEYVFLNWSNGSTDNPISFELNSDTNLTANFEKRKYALTINILGEGIVTEEIIETGKSTDYESGTKVKLTAVPSEGWVFRSWGELIENQELSFEIIIDEPKEVNVVFDEIVEEEYFSVNYEGNGTFIRYGAPYPPLKSYGVELIEGEVNDDGDYLNGSTLRFTYQNNPGWFLSNFYKRENFTEIPEMAVINDFHQFKWYEILEGEPFVINENIYIPINVATTMDTFPYDQEESFGIFPKVGQNTDLYPEWNEPSNEYNWYVTNNFSWPGYVEAYKDRLFQITQVVGDFGPLDILIFDWEADPDHNREMYAKSRKEYGIGLYENQIYPYPNGGNAEVENYDRIAAEGGYPFGSASARLGGRKYVGEINKEGKKEILTNWSNHLGITVEELIKRDEFHWDWVGIHEPLHIWQVSSEKHGWMNDMAGCTYCGRFSEIGFDEYEKLFDKLNPRWFMEGQIIALEDWFMEKIGLRDWPDSSGFEDTEKIMDVRYKLKNRWFMGHREDGFDRLQRHEYKEDLSTILSVAGVYIEEGLGVLNGFESLTPVKGYFDTGIIASYYMFAKMNHDLDNYLEFNTTRGADGFDVAMQQYLGLTEQQFYDEFNTWFFDSGLTEDQKIDYLWPEGTDPIQVDIQSRR